MKKNVISILIFLFLFIQFNTKNHDGFSGMIGFLFGNELKKITPPSGVASTFIGGTDTDDAYEPSIALDHEGNVYISGFTLSKDFPTTKDAFGVKFNGGKSDRFISKLNGNLKLLLASTYIGGKGLASPFIGGNGDELGHAVAIDSDGYVYIAGYTESPDFPTSDGAYDRSYNGGRDVYVSKFDSKLKRLIASTFIGGTGDEGYKWPRIGMIVDKKGNIYVTGLTHSVDFPTSINAFDRSFNGGPESGDIFIVKIDNNLSKILGSTYLGGAKDEWRVSITIDEKNNVIVCGETESPDFPTIPGSYDNNMNVKKDIFISKFNHDLTKLTSSTLFGGSGIDEALSIKASKQGNIFITGYTESRDFPTTSNAYRRKWSGGDRDAYLAQFSNNLDKLIACTLFGGSSRDVSKGLFLNNQDQVYVVGVTSSTDFPITKKILNRNSFQGLDSFIAKFDTGFNQLLWSTAFGGSKNDVACCIAMDRKKNLFIAGNTSSLDFPVTNDVYDVTYNGGFYDCFLVRISLLVLE